MFYLVQHTQGFVFVLNKIYAEFVCTDQSGTQLEQLSSVFLFGGFQSQQRILRLGRS